MTPWHPFVSAMRGSLPAIALSGTPPAAAAKSTATAAAPTRLLRTRFVHCQCPAAHIRAIERRNRGLRLGIRGHFHESKAAGLPGELVRDNPRRSDRPMRAKQITQLLLGRRIGQPTDINLRTHVGFLL